MTQSRHRASPTRSGPVARAAVGLIVLACVGSVVVVGGCQQVGCHSESERESDEQNEVKEGPWLAQTSALEGVSSKASVVVGIRRAAYLKRLGEHLSQKWDSTQGGSPSGGVRDPEGHTTDAGAPAAQQPSRALTGWTERLRRLIGVSESVVPGGTEDEAGAQPVGVSRSEPAVLFRESQRWVFGIEVADRQRLFSRLNRGKVEWFGPEDGRRTGLLSVGPGASRHISPGFGVCVMEKRLFVGELKRREGYSERIDAMCNELGSRKRPGPVGEWTDRWTRGAREASLVTSLTGGSEVAAGLVRPDVLLRRADGSSGDGHAKTLIDRLAGQLGSLGWTMHSDRKRGAVSATMRLQQSPGQPMAVVDLGAATGSLPQMGGLVDERALGAVRLSADPELTYQLGRSLLPAEVRRNLDGYWKKFRDELTVDVPGSLLNAMSGHVVVAIFGIIPRSRMGGNENAETGRQRASFWRHLVNGEATREAVMVPITDRSAVERILNVATQLSRGRLSRDKGEHSVHYAWVGERGLSWAVVLTDEYVVFADSGLAFNRAVNFARDAVPVTEGLRRRGVHRLFEGRTRSGFYVQNSLVTERLRRRGWSHVANVAEPIEWLLFTSETAGGEGIGRLDLGYGDPQPDKNRDGAENEEDAGEKR